MRLWLFPNLLPWNRRRALASTCQQIKPFLGPECNRFHDHRHVEGMDAMASDVRKIVVVITARVVGAKDGSRGSCVGIRWDERAELGSLIVRVEFIVDLFSDELYK